VTVSSEMQGIMRLSKAAGSVYEELVQAYEEILEAAIEERLFQVDNKSSDSTRRLADRIGALKGEPRDIIEIHCEAVRNKSRNVPMQKAKAYIESARIIVLEIMGYLALYYRSYRSI